VTPKRSWIERLKVPKKFRIKNCCCQLKATLYFCFFIMTIIDVLVLVKYIVMFTELIVYKSSYPWLVTFDISIKAAIQVFIVWIQCFKVIS